MQNTLGPHPPPKQAITRAMFTRVSWQFEMKN